VKVDDLERDTDLYLLCPFLSSAAQEGEGGRSSLRGVAGSKVEVEEVRCPSFHFPYSRISRTRTYLREADLTLPVSLSLSSSDKFC